MLHLTKTPGPVHFCPVGSGWDSRTQKVKTGRPGVRPGKVKQLIQDSLRYTTRFLKTHQTNHLSVGRMPARAKGETLSQSAHPTLISPLSSPVANRMPSGEKAEQRTQPVWPSKSWRGESSSKLQIWKAIRNGKHTLPTPTRPDLSATQPKSQSHASQDIWCCINVHKMPRSNLPPCQVLGTSL